MYIGKMECVDHDYKAVVIIGDLRFSGDEIDTHSAEYIEGEHNTTVTTITVRRRKKVWVYTLFNRDRELSRIEQDGQFLA